MPDCPGRNSYVNDRLCDIFYPYGCGARCTNLYNKWIAESEEVRGLEEEKERQDE